MSEIPVDTNNAFTQVVELLLAGEVVCRYTRETEFQYLEQSDVYHQVDAYLRRIGRKLRRTSQEDGYLLAHAHTHSARAKREARQAFDEMSRYIRPMVYWLSLAKKVRPHGNPLKAGELLNESELLRAIEESTEITRELDNLCRLKPFQNDSRRPAGQLSRVLQKLVDMGYLIVVGHSKTVYKATARLSLFYDLIAFIQEYEQLGDSQPSDEQQMEMLDGR